VHILEAIFTAGRFQRLAHTGVPSVPILIRVEAPAGHGAGKPVWMQIEDFADQWAFLGRWLEMPLPAGGTAQ
jgi:hypothetical protein